VCKILLQYYFGLFLLLFYCPSFLIDPNSTIAIVKIVLNSIATIAHFGENNELNLHTTEKNQSVILSSIGSDNRNSVDIGDRIGTFLAHCRCFRIDNLVHSTCIPKIFVILQDE